MFHDCYISHVNDSLGSCHDLMFAILFLIRISHVNCSRLTFGLDSHASLCLLIRSSYVNCSRHRLGLDSSASLCLLGCRKVAFADIFTDPLSDTSHLR